MTKSKKTRKKEARRQQSATGAWLPTRGGFITVGVVSMALAIWTAYQANRALPLWESILWGLIFGGSIWAIFLIVFLVNRYLRRP